MSRFPIALGIASIALAAVAPAAAQQPFQGAITTRMTAEDGTTHDATFLVKGSRVRMEMAAPNGEGTIAMITDRDAKKSWMLMPERQMYMERDLDAAPPAGMPARPAAEKPAITWTGKTETIAGMKCDDATSAEPDGTVYEMCIAKGIPFFMGGPPGGGRMGRGMGAGAGQPGRGMGRGMGGGAWARGVEGGFPLRVQKRGAAQPLLLVTKIEARTIADDQLAPPAGWQKMSMPDMRGMGGGRP